MSGSDESKSTVSLSASKKELSIVLRKKKRDRKSPADSEWKQEALEKEQSQKKANLVGLQPLKRKTRVLAEKEGVAEQERVVKLKRKQDPAIEIFPKCAPPVSSASFCSAIAPSALVKVRKKKKAELSFAVRKFPSRVELVFASEESKLAAMPSFKKKLEALGIRPDHYKLTRKCVKRNQVVVVVRAKTAVLEQIKDLIKPKDAVLLKK